MLTKDEIEALENWLDSNCHFDAPSPNDKTWELSADALEKLAAAAIDAHTRKVLEDVEPVAFMFQHSETGRITFVDAWQKENGWAAGNPRFFEVDALVPASTLAAAQALNAELVARLEGLEKDAARYRWLRDGELTADYPYPVMRMGGSRVDDQTIWADELDAAIDDAISAAQHPQQEQPK